MKKRKIAIVTGTRGSYGLLRPIMDAIKKHSSLELHVIATAMHLSKKFGYTVREIRKDGFKVNAEVKMLSETDTKKDMGISLGKGIIGIVKALEKIKPDILLITGDWWCESFMATIAALTLEIPVAHIHGGDITPWKRLDETVRHATTKMAHIHFPATKKSAQRILNLGEEKKRVYFVGAPGVDNAINMKKIPAKILAKKYSFDLDKPIILALLHPFNPKLARKQMQEFISVLKKIEKQTILIYPNTDIGGISMIEVIEKTKLPSNIKACKNIHYKDFISLMKIADVFVGNSSSGIIEAPSLGLPVVNIGLRQQEREKAANVINVNYNKNELIKAMNKALNDKKFIRKVKKCKSPYGGGKAGIRIANVLSKIKINENLLHKKLITNR